MIQNNTDTNITVEMNFIFSNKFTNKSVANPTFVQFTMIEPFFDSVEGVFRYYPDDREAIKIRVS